MNETKTYNGWTNYETWAVKLWMDNEQGSHLYSLERATAAYRGAVASESLDRAERAAVGLAESLKAEYEEANPLAEESSVWSDLLSAALSEVNWYEIARSLVGDVAEEIGDD